MFGDLREQSSMYGGWVMKVLLLAVCGPKFTKFWNGIVDT